MPHAASTTCSVIQITKQQRVLLSIQHQAGTQHAMQHSTAHHTLKTTQMQDPLLTFRDTQNASVPVPRALLRLQLRVALEAAGAPQATSGGVVLA